MFQFSVHGWSCVPSLRFTWGQTLVEVKKIMVTSLKRYHTCTATLSAPNTVAGHHQLTPLTETPRHPQATLGQSPVSHCLFSWVLEHKVLLCPPRVYFPVLCKFWQLYGGVNGDLLQEGLCHNQDCCTQSRPTPPQEMLKHSSGSVSVGSLGPGAQGLFEPSECL